MEELMKSVQEGVWKYLNTRILKCGNVNVKDFEIPVDDTLKKASRRDLKEIGKKLGVNIVTYGEHGIERVHIHIEEDEWSWAGRQMWIAEQLFNAILGMGKLQIAR